MTSENLISLENPVLESYLFYSAILMMKMMAMSFLTRYQRHKKNVYPNIEDAALHKNSKVAYDDPDVERVRRAHQNDIENIYVFVIAGFIYVLTDPFVTVAFCLFRVYAASRIVHTLVYAVIPMPQPTRAISYTVGCLITLYMLIQGVVTFV